VNDGAGRFSEQPDAFPDLGDATLGLDLGDVDGDGRLDAVTAQGETGDSWVERLYLGVGTAVDTRAPALVDAEAAGSVLWLRARDETVGDGPGRVEVSAEIGGERRVATWSGGDLFRLTGVTLPLTVTLTDRAGNAADVEIPAPPGEEQEPEGCGCATGGGPGWGWLAAGAVVALRRRR
jgi:MYXO-CTERM domain-containing protein